MGKELRILMLEDLEEDAGLLDRALSREKIAFTRIRVESKQEFIKALDSFEPELILSDHALPQFNSIEALKIAQENRPGIPFIIVTGSVSEEFAVSCIKKGANDYVLKSNLSRLPIAIRHSMDEQLNRKVREEQDDILKKQNAELIKINRELDSFVYNISHNLRSPLASVIGLVNVARLDNNKSIETADQYFDMIGMSSLKLDNTLKEILDYSQNLRTELEISETNFETLCHESFTKLERLDDFSTIEKKLEIRTEAAFYSDNYRLKAILSHLLSNCLKYKDDKKSNSQIRVNVSVSQQSAALTIWDNGVGIHQDHLPKVFNMFVRLNENSDGAGLGLFVVKEMVEKLGGTIDISSLYGEWTQVSIKLPNGK